MTTHPNNREPMTPEGQSREDSLRLNSQLVPKTTWRRTVEREMQEAGWRSWDDARRKAGNREGWRKSVKALCATGREVR
mgnify:CR=1 FL=1